MRLTQAQAQKTTEKLNTGNYINLPGYGLFTTEEVTEAIEKEHLIFSFENNILYVSLGAIEKVNYRQGKDRVLKFSTLDPSESLFWLEKTHPSANREEMWFKQTKATNEEFEEWLEQPAKESPTNATPLKETLRQRLPHK